MALIKCPECGKEISDTIESCIHCGFVLQKINNDEIDANQDSSNNVISTPSTTTSSDSYQTTNTEKISSKMKIFIGVLIILLIILFFKLISLTVSYSPSVDTSTTTEENQTHNNSESTSKPTTEVATNIIETKNDGIIRFNKIKWYSRKLDVENYLFSEGITKGGWSSGDGNIYRLDAIDYLNVTLGDERVDEGGKKVWYSGMNVGGYIASNTYACYVYSLNEDGTINRSEDDTIFYFGWHTFEDDDYSNFDQIFSDLKSKLTSVYGEGITQLNKYNKTVTWKDKQGNKIQLLIDDDSTYVTLGYIAADADKLLDNMQAALKKEKALEEESVRNENKDNVSGL